MAMTWHEGNNLHMASAVALIRTVLEAYLAPGSGEGANNVVEAAERTLIAIEKDLPSPSALERLVAMFRLTPFERDLVLLCAAAEIDPSIGALYAQAQQNPNRPFATFNLALALFTGSHWDALTADAPLRRWRIIELLSRESLTTARLRIDERILHYLLGAPTLDERLASLLSPFTGTIELLPSHKPPAQRGARFFEQLRESPDRGCIQLCGPEEEGKRSIAAWIADWTGMRPYLLRATDIPADIAEQLEMARLLDREALLNDLILVIDSGEEDNLPALAASRSIVGRLGAPVIILAREAIDVAGRSALRFDVRKPTVEEQRTLWRNMLGDTADGIDDDLEMLIGQFNLGIGAARAAGGEVSAYALANNTIPRDLPWDVCRIRSRSRLEGLAMRIETNAAWEDLVLPELQKQMLRTLASHVRQRIKVYDQWGFGRRGRGLGTTALFAGPSGTGKTMAAEVIAAELKLDLYHIDLSQVVSKYIGETEKNLRRIFDAAEEGGAVLLFDEADALFGKRSEVKDSHDRHANIEVSYLLQRMESYRGLAILTTNMKEALDTAFLRRIRFVVSFPFPDAANRAEIWSRLIPADAPTDGIDFNKLASLNVSGGSIWNIAVNAAFIAADAGEPIRMRHILTAARTEYLKLEKHLSDAETRDWIR